MSRNKFHNITSHQDGTLPVIPKAFIRVVVDLRQLAFVGQVAAQGAQVFRGFLTIL